MTIELLTWLALGLAAVCFGGEALVKGASSLSRRLGMRPLLIGILVVAFASDSPELAPAIRAAESGYSHLALGTLLGSTIFTILFVLGGCSLLLPARVSYRLVRQDVPILLGAAILLLLLSFDGRLSALDGLLLLACLAVFIVFLIVRSESEREETKRAYDHEYRQEFPEQGRDLKTALFFLLGLGLLWLGSVALVEATIEIGHGIGVTDLVMGLTILGIGTSTPETASAITSILRGEREIAIGHLIGSSIFTLLGGLGSGCALCRRRFGYSSLGAPTRHSRADCRGRRVSPGLSVWPAAAPMGRRNFPHCVHRLRVLPRNERDSPRDGTDFCKDDRVFPRCACPAGAGNGASLSGPRSYRGARAAEACRTRRSNRNRRDARVLERFFRLAENNTTVQREIAGGVTTFMTMAYIVFVQPVVMNAAGIDLGAAMVATCVSSAVATFLMGLIANYPVALAPAMGHNFFFTYTVVLVMGYTWQQALGAVFLASALFLVLSLFGLRERLLNEVPNSLKHAIAVGIGLLIAAVGLEWCGLVVDNPGTLVGMGRSQFSSGAARAFRTRPHGHSSRSPGTRGHAHRNRRNVDRGAPFRNGEVRGRSRKYPLPAADIS